MKKVIYLVLLLGFFIPIQAKAIIFVPTNNITFIVAATPIDGSFEFNASVQIFEPNLPQNFSISTVNSVGQQTFNVVSFNNFTFQEIIPEGWQLDNIDCESNGTGTHFFVNQNYLSITPAPFENIVCNFNNSQIAAVRTPVLFIPGTMGTEILKGTEKIWPDVTRMLLTNNDRFMDPLSFKDDETPLDTSLTLGLVLDEETGFDYTKNLKKDFADQGYQENKDLFLFPYDWRDDIAKNADVFLSQKIDSILASSTSPKIDIIAHSQGGLVIKRLLYDHPEYESKIRKLVLLGTPNLGTPKAAKALLYGDSAGVALAGLGLDPEEVKRISQNMPAVYEMLPSPEYFNHSDGYWGTLEVPWFSDPKVTLYDYQTTKDKLKADGYNSSLLDSAENFHSQVFDDFDFSNTGIETFNIMGCETPTLNSMLVKKFGEDKFEYGPGDGTVPIFSASNTIGTQNFYVLNNNDLHAKMPSFNGIRQKVVNLVSGSSLPTEDITSNAVDCKFNGTQVSTHSPVDMHIYDEQGNHVGPMPDGSIEFNIPGVAYDIIDHQKFAFLPKGHTYTLKLIATDNGSFSFHSEIISAGQSQGSVYFNNVPITAESKAEINLNDSNTQPILLDSNGDGNVDQTLQPSSIINASQSQDVIAPISSSTISGVMGSSGFYRSDVNINLNAVDPVIETRENETSGILKLNYKVDAGTWQQASSSAVNFSVQAEGSHTLTFFSTDKAGNNEQVQTINFVIDKTAPEFNVQFNTAVRDLVFSATDASSSTTSALTVLDADDTITAQDSAGNQTVITLKDKNRKKSLKAEIKSLAYNGIAADISKTVLKFNWLFDKNNQLQTLEQHIKSKKDFNIDAVYKNNQTVLTGKDQGGKLNQTLNGVVVLKVGTNKGDFSWTQ